MKAAFSSQDFSQWSLTENVLWVTLEDITNEYGHLFTTAKLTGERLPRFCIRACKTSWTPHTEVDTQNRILLSIINLLRFTVCNGSKASAFTSPEKNSSLSERKHWSFFHGASGPYRSKKTHIWKFRTVVGGAPKCFLGIFNLYSSRSYIKSF